MRLDENHYPVPTGSIETLEADSVILALGQDTDTTFLKNVPGIAFKSDGQWSWDPTCRPAAQAYLRAATWCRARERSRRPWGTARKPRSTSTPGSVARRGRRRRSTRSQRSRCCGSGITPRRKRGQSTIDLERRRHTFDEVVAGLDSTAARYEAQRCLSCGNCFECDGATRRAPSRPSSSWARAGVRLRPGQVHRLRDLLRPVPVRRDHDDPGATRDGSRDV